LAKKQFNLHTMLSFVVTRAHMLKKNIEVILDIDQTLPEYIVADETRFAQAITNIVENAVKFTEKGYVKIKADRKSAELVFTIEDTGIGIKEEDQKAIFERFHQVVRNDNEQAGAGLGLAIALQQVQLMEGTITLKSEYGKGTSFFISIPDSSYEFIDAEEYSKVPTNMDSTKKSAPTNLPFSTPTTREVVREVAREVAREVMREAAREAVRETASAPTSTSSSPTKPTSPRRVLIAEDNKVSQLVIRRMLENEGFEVHVVENGKLAVEKIKQETFHLCIMDLRMPVMDGLQATAAIRKWEKEFLKDPIKDRLIVVALTSSAELQCQCKEFDRFMGKPFSYSKLVDTLQDQALQLR